MLEPWMIEAFAHLDRALLRACETEERRAGLLASGGAVGWEGVRNLARPAVEDLLFDGNDPTPLLADVPPVLAGLRSAFDLDPVEIDALWVLFAPHVEPRYRSLYGVLQDALTEPWVTERLLLTVLGRTPERRRVLLRTLAPAGRLRETGLVTFGDGQPPMGAAVDLAPELRSALLELGRPPAHDVIPLTWITGERPASLRNALDAPAAFIVFGEGAREDVLAELVGGAARVLGGPVRDGERAGVLARSLWRLGALHAVVPVLDLTELEELPARRLVEQMVRRIREWGGRLAFLSSQAMAVAIPQHEAPRQGFSERRRIWLEVASERGVGLDPAAAARLASAYRLEPGRVREIFESADGADEAALARQAARLTSRRIPHGNSITPTRTFDDIVLVDTTRDGLRRLIFFVDHRDRIAEERGLEHRFQLQRGPIVLFSGRSGTGKTLAAEIVAEALARPLHVVDLARLVSKYIGETEKNIDEVLATGERAGAVLFFDEADSLFSQRTEVSTSNDRFANLEVGYLLQRIETHDGLVILSTNLRQSIDEAFLRRFHTRIEFPLPGPKERRRIWELMLPPGVPRSEDLVFDTLGREHNLSGGDIRNAALKAIFLAEQAGSPVTQRHLERAVALELLELGRLSRRREDCPDWPDGPGVARDRGLRLRAFTKALQSAVEAHLRDVFLKEIQIVHGAPTKENLAGKRPAISLALFRLAQPRNGGLRLGLVVSAWSNRAEEEHELLGVLHELLSGDPLAATAGVRAATKVAESNDFDLLHRFWSSHGHPVRASVVLDVELLE